MFAIRYLSLPPLLKALVIRLVLIMRQFVSRTFSQIDNQSTNDVIRDVLSRSKQMISVRNKQQKTASHRKDHHLCGCKGKSGVRTLPPDPSEKNNTKKSNVIFFKHRNADTRKLLLYYVHVLILQRVHSFIQICIFKFPFESMN